VLWAIGGILLGGGMEVFFAGDERGSPRQACRIAPDYCDCQGAMQSSRGANLESFGFRSAWQRVP
jgi:hypothetical protein